MKKLIAIAFLFVLMSFDTTPDKVYVEECNDSGGCWYREYVVTGGSPYTIQATGNCAFSSTGAMLHTCTPQETRD